MATDLLLVNIQGDGLPAVEDAWLLLVLQVWFGHMHALDYY